MPNNTISLQQLAEHRRDPDDMIPAVALVGAPNAGKTALFNKMTGLRAKSANFPGTTLEVRMARLKLESSPIDLCDLPGLYTLEGGEQEERLAADVLVGKRGMTLNAYVVVLDAMHLARQLALATEVIELGKPVLVLLTQCDLARANSIKIDEEHLMHKLGATVMRVSGRTGEGVNEALAELNRLLEVELDIGFKPPFAEDLQARCVSCDGCKLTARHGWACHVTSTAGEPKPPSRFAEWCDGWMTHPVAGMAFFALMMAAFFMSLFYFAGFPMGWVDSLFEWLSGLAKTQLQAINTPELLIDFVANGVIGGVGGVVIFLPQICILFFLLALLEDTGYLARAALVMDRVMQKVGLPGRAFVPMLSAHACAIPAIMSTRILPSRRDRLVSMMVLPLLTCSARLPVYAMVAGLVFAGNAWQGGLLFAGAYFLGIFAALCVAWVLRHTILPGKPTELLIELPAWHRPSMRNAVLSALDRGLVFLKQAGSVILVLSMVLWVLNTFPRLSPEQAVAQLSPLQQERLEVVDALLQVDYLQATEREILSDEQQGLLQVGAAKGTIAGRVGTAVEPVFTPLGFDWRINVGVVSSFAAREVILTSLAIVAGKDEQAAEEDGFVDTLAAMKREDGTKLFDLPTSMALLVFFVLAMQCLPTQAITRRETGSWKWPMFQIAYMTALAWGSGATTYFMLSMFV